MSRGLGDVYKRQFQDLKLKEVADIIGIGLPLVKYRIGKAKELLSVYLGDKK